MDQEKAPRQVYVVSHGSGCLDGLAAAVIIARAYPDAVVHPVFCSHAEIDGVLRTLEPPAGAASVWITDIGWTDPTVDRHLQQLRDRGVDVYWVDHHRTTLTRWRQGAIMVRLSDYVLSEEYAATRLTYDRLCRHLGAAAPQRFVDASRLVAMADDHDRWLHRIAGSRELAWAVGALRPREAYEELLQIDERVTLTPRLREALDRARTRQRRSLAIAAGSRRVRPLGGGLTLVSAVCDGYASDIGDAWGRTATNSVFAFFDAQSLTVNLRRSPDCTVDLSALASRLGGGGHPVAAGCQPAALLDGIADAVGRLVGAGLGDTPAEADCPSAPADPGVDSTPHRGSF